MLRVLTMMAGVILGVLVDTVPVAAATPWIVSRANLPFDGASDVPLNARIVLSYDVRHLAEVPQQGISLSSIVVRPIGGEPLHGLVSINETATTVTVLFETLQLSPNTQYQVLSKVRVNDPQWLVGPTEEFVGGFRTTSSSDLTPPAEPKLQVEYEDCETGTPGAFRVSWDRPQDALVEVRQVVLNGGTLWSLEDGFRGAPEGSSMTTDFKGDGKFEVRFVDLAGNASNRVAAEAKSPCPAAEAEVERDFAEPVTDSVLRPREGGCDASFSFPSWIAMLLWCFWLSRRLRQRGAFPGRPVVDP